MNYLVKCGEGLGFLVKGRESVYIITAASLLEEIPELNSPNLYDRILGDFVGPIDGEQNIAAEILHIDLISGIAVLGLIRGYQTMGSETNIDELFKQTTLLDVARPPAALEGKIGASFIARVHKHKVQILSQGTSLHIIDSAPPASFIGAPIVIKYKGPAPNAIGVVTSPTCLQDSLRRLKGGGFKTQLAMAGDAFHEGGRNPALSPHLPGWLLEELAIKSAVNTWNFKETEDRFDFGYLDGDAWARTRGSLPEEFPGHQCEQDALLRNYGRYSSCLSRFPRSARDWILQAYYAEKGILYDNNNSYLRGFLAGAAAALQDRGIEQGQHATAAEKAKFMEAVWCAIGDTPFDMRRMTDFFDMFARTGHREQVFSTNKLAKKAAIDFLLTNSKPRDSK